MRAHLASTKVPQKMGHEFCFPRITILEVHLVQRAHLAETMMAQGRQPSSLLLVRLAKAVLASRVMLNFVYLLARSKAY